MSAPAAPLSQEELSEIAARYRARADHFQMLVAGVADGAWQNQSPCEKWTARDVVAHVIVMHHVVLAPAGVPMRGLDVGEDPWEVFVETRRLAERVLSDPALAGVADRSPMGTAWLAVHFDEAISADLPVHGWDLAKATGQDATIAPEDVAAGLAWQASMSEVMLEKFRTPGAFGAGIEVFGPVVEVGPGASAQDRMLAALGRDNGWTLPPG